ncbi:MAG: archaellar assembly protein FlaJ [Anaerolineae bacterium]|nr:archaellar assembly protein FlaJ [Anaerolineae bacterium]
MNSSRSSPKRTANIYSKEISGFDLFHLLTHMSVTAASGISRDRVFHLAAQLLSPPALYLGEVNRLVDNMRYNYPDACRMVGQRVKSENGRSFLLRLSDALQSGEPMADFLAREARVQGEHYTNEYERGLESLKKWNDGYTSVTVSVALIVIVNMVSTMIYDIGATTMLGLVFLAVLAGSSVAWVLYRAAPQEVKSVSLAEGSREQRLALRLFKIFAPVAAVVSLALMLLDMDKGWILVTASLLLFFPGVVSLVADGKVNKKDAEVGALLRSVGGMATSIGTTLTEALTKIDIASFPALEPDVKMLNLRLQAIGQPEFCWQKFATETGSKMISQTIGVFYEGVNLGGDPERVGTLSSLFATKTYMLRAKRQGVAATFSWLLIIMHAIMTGLMIFLLEIVRQFGIVLEEAMASIDLGAETAQFATSMFSFGSVRIPLLEQMTLGMVLVLVVINAFAIVADEGAHFIKIVFYLSLMLLLSGICYLIIPSTVQMVM